MIIYATGNLFESPAQTLVNTVNTEGVMGKGIALQFKQIFPEMFAEYQKLCEDGRLRIGTLHVYRTPHKLVLNFPTKVSWRRPSSPEYIAAGLKTFVDNYNQAGIHSVAFPPLGCGNGELDWSVVRPLMERHLAPLPIPVYIYPPRAEKWPAEHRMPKVIRAWLRSEPRSLPFGEMWNDLAVHLEEPKALETLGKGTPFTAQLIEDGDEAYILIQSDGKSATIDKQVLRVLWRDLQHHGMVTARGLPDPRVAPHLFPILESLPYVSVFQLAESYESFEAKKMYGLQVVAAQPPKAQKSLELAV